MISMTGYGRGEAHSAKFSVALEVKTVNHRHSEIVVKLPPGMWEMEVAIQQKVQEVISRGRTEVYVHLLSPIAGIHEPVVDMDLAAKYLKALHQAGASLGITGQVDLSLLASLPDVVRVEERPIHTALVSPLIDKALQQALKRLISMRQSEGRKLAADIRQRLDNVLQRIKKIQKQYQVASRLQEDRLQERIAAWLHTDQTDSRRLAQEAAFKHIRADVTEEIVRLSSHVSQFGAFMRLAEPVGRRLDFLLQEMNREVNTIGSKAADAVIAQQVVDIKEELEKIREQVQNLE